MPKYIQKRRKRWYGVMEIPKALHTTFNKPRFVQSLETESQSIAEVRVLPLIPKWKQEIALARAYTDSGNELLDSVIKVRQDTQRLKAQ